MYVSVQNVTRLMSAYATLPEVRSNWIPVSLPKCGTVKDDPLPFKLRMTLHRLHFGGAGVVTLLMMVLYFWPLHNPDDEER